MKNNPKVSVIMPNYNCEKYIGEAIESILNQTFSDFEFIIIDDCSADKSWEIIQQYVKKDKRIIALRNKKNLQICKTLNKGLEMARGEYIARMDSDDISVLNRFEKQVNLLDKNNYIGIIGGNVQIIDDKGKNIMTKNYPSKNIKSQIWYRNPFIHPGLMIRKECFDNCGNYDEKFLYAEDLELWIRFGCKYDFYNLNDIILKYRVFGGNSTIKKQKIMIKNTLKARKEAMKLGYKITFKGWIFYFGTWCMQFLPPKLVLWIFNFINK